MRVVSSIVVYDICWRVFRLILICKYWQLLTSTGWWAIIYSGIGLDFVAGKVTSMSC